MPNNVRWDNSTLRFTFSLIRNTASFVSDLKMWTFGWNYTISHSRSYLIIIISICILKVSLAYKCIYIYILIKNIIFCCKINNNMENDKIWMKKTLPWWTPNNGWTALTFPWHTHHYYYSRETTGLTNNEPSLCEQAEKTTTFNVIYSKETSTVKPAHVVTCIKQTTVLRGHHFLVLSYELN